MKTMSCPVTLQCFDTARLSVVVEIKFLNQALELFIRITHIFLITTVMGTPFFISNCFLVFLSDIKFLVNSSQIFRIFTSSICVSSIVSKLMHNVQIICFRNDSETSRLPLPLCKSSSQGLKDLFSSCFYP